jgi:hypothetical protein
LEEQFTVIKRLRERINELRISINDTKDGVKVYYAVDFSELYAYLNVDRLELDDVVGVNLDIRHPEKGVLQHRLGLTHLFTTFSDTLYMLPPHTLELWSYIRTQTREKADSSNYNNLLERTRRLAPEHKQLLESLRDKEHVQNLAEELLRFVKSKDFGPLCVDVSEFVNWYKQGSLLKNLVRTNRFSYQIDRLLANYNINFSELKDTTRPDVLELVKRTPSERRRKRRNQTIIDARAILLLRELNHLLKGSNVKVVLITRDIHIYELVKSIANEPWFRWAEAGEHVRGIESIFLDLILKDTMPISRRLGWILESDMKLASMQESVSRILQQLHHYGGKEGGINPIVQIGNKVLHETAKLWDQHINLKLSLASNSVPWLGKSFTEFNPEGGLPANFNEFQREYDQLKNLFDFLSTQVYQNLATRDIETVWSDFEADCLRMGLLNLGKSEAERISRILTETFTGKGKYPKTILRSKQFLRMTPVQFVSKSYQERLKLLRVNAEGEYNRAFLSVIYEAVSAFNEPEDFLFMAFVLGIIEEWDGALTLIEKCREMMSNMSSSELSGLVVPSEVDYMISLIRRKLAELRDDPGEAIEGYITSFYEIKRAVDSKPTDPRYVKDLAFTAMLYHDALKRLSVWQKTRGVSISHRLDQAIPTEAEAKTLCKHALELASDSNDLRLKVGILNNLAYAEVLTDSPSYEEAEDYLRQIDDFNSEDSDWFEQFTDGVLVYVTDTRIMLRARRAKDSHDKSGLLECINKLDLLAQQEGLSEAERKMCVSHIEMLRAWLSESS